MKTYLYRASNLKSTITFLASVSWRSQFLAPARTIISCDLFIIVIIIIIIFIKFFRRVFSECTEAITTSLIILETILPEKCAFIIGFSSTVCTKMRCMAGSSPDDVLADIILILPHPPIPPTDTTHQYKEGKWS